MENLLNKLAMVVSILICTVGIVDACPCGPELSEEEKYFIVKIVDKCPCGPKLPVEEAYLKSDGIFIGKVVESRLAGFKVYDQAYKYMEYNLEVVKKYKGNIIDNKVIIRTGLGGSDCGYRFLLGKEYIIYGSQYKANLYSTNSCARNREIISREEREIKILEKLSEK